jgi:dTDP-4-dehydrorhamnose reductase
MKILITGKNGLVGQALKNQNTGWKTVFVGREEADLTNPQEVESLQLPMDRWYQRH